MEFPEDILQIIREYSKPVTRSNWREGAPHGNIFKHSMTSHIVKQVICYYYRDFEWMKYCYPELESDIPFSDILIRYGDKIFPCYNFYHIMIRQNILTKTSYFTYQYRNGQQEWIYK